MGNTFASGTPMWVDLGTTDVAAAGQFYGSLLGWTVEPLGPESGGYGYFRKDGKMVGGIGPATDPSRGSSWSVYFATSDADDTAARVRANGGNVVVEPMDVFDQGRMAVFQDPQGAYFSVWQPKRHTGAELVNAFGAMGWVELMTSDVNAAKPFYEAVLGVATRDVNVNSIQYTLLEKDGQSVAGAMQIPPDRAEIPPHWSVFFYVDDCDGTADRAIEMGAREMMRQTLPPGRMSYLIDPQGAGFYLMQPNPEFSV